MTWGPRPSEDHFRHLGGENNSSWTPHVFIPIDSFCKKLFLEGFLVNLWGVVGGLWRVLRLWGGQKATLGGPMATCGGTLVRAIGAYRALTGRVTAGGIGCLGEDSGDLAQWRNFPAVKNSWLGLPRDTKTCASESQNEKSYSEF